MPENKKILFEKILNAAVERNASDIHLIADEPPTLRIEGKLNKLNTKEINSSEMNDFIKGFMPESKQVIFSEQGNIDFSFQLENTRYRGNAARDQHGTYVTLRLIPSKIRDIREIGFPNENVWQDIVSLQSGLVLVTGVTGSGKSTTLSSIIEEINKTRGGRIITIEDPIEQVYKAKNQSLISQREIGTDLKSFSDGVKYALRQDPDIILIGEIRDYETAEKTLEAAMTGHLVFSTLHTRDCSETVSRYVSLFEEAEQDKIKNILASTLNYTISQQLIPYQKGVGRTVAMEILNNRPASVKNSIRKGEYHKIISEIQTGRKYGMNTMDNHLEILYIDGKIDKNTALQYAHDRPSLESKLG